MQPAFHSFPPCCRPGYRGRGRYVASRSRVEIVLGQGHCEVHEQSMAADLAACRQRNGDVAILAHPECSPDVLAGADFVGSTAGMIRHLAAHAPRRVFLATERSMTDNLAVQFPGIEFIRHDHFCSHMRRITLPGILRAIETLQPAVEIDPAVAGAARRAVRRMLELNLQPASAHGEARRAAPPALPHPLRGAPAPDPPGGPGPRRQPDHGRHRRPGLVTEASGRITPETAPAIAATGVDLLSVGWITHSAPTLDVALDIALPR